MVSLGNSWDEILRDEFEKEYYQKIRKFLVYEYNHYRIFPDMHDIFNALKLSDYNEIKVVIIGQDPCQMLRTLGHRTKVLHIHDNGGIEDDHLIPTRGVIDWKRFATTLGEVGYNGTFNFEVYDHFSEFAEGPYGREVFQQACNLLYAIGRSLADIAEGKHSVE